MAGRSQGCHRPTLDSLINISKQLKAFHPAEDLRYLMPMPLYTFHIFDLIFNPVQEQSQCIHRCTGQATRWWDCRSCHDGPLTVTDYLGLRPRLVRMGGSSGSIVLHFNGITLNSSATGPMLEWVDSRTFDGERWPPHLTEHTAEWHGWQT